MFHFVLLLHAHQPVGNFDSVIEEAYRHSYLPSLKLLERHAGVSLSLHFSGTLLEWIEARHPEYLDLLRRLIQRRQVELLGGGYYEPILSSIPEADQRAQLDKLASYLAGRFGARPRGIWLTERVWEPHLPQTLAEAGVEFTLTDDTHFLSAGLESDELYGDYLTETTGSAVRVIPGLKDLRYLIPFRDVGETVEYCRRAAGVRPDGLAAMGDDLEKFGAWPGTYQHVHVNGWLERFFAALEAESSWLCPVRASDYLGTHAPLGRIYLPTASYHEMMEWALPVRAGEAYERVLGRLRDMRDGTEIARFLRGGVWDNFFHRYSEANLLHKRMLAVSRRLARLRAGNKADFEDAYDHLLAGQCNDAYWHGVFGGLYAPHLRHAVYAHLLEADRAADLLEGSRPVRVSSTDFDVDGLPEVTLESDALFALLDPGDGATMPEIDFKPAAVNVVNALMRRRENYHKKVALHAAGGAPVASSIHERAQAKEEGLERVLIYDRYERACFRAYVFSLGKTFDDFSRLALDEHAGLAAGSYDWDAGRLVCRRREAGVDVRKEFRMEGDRLSCAVHLEALGGGPTGLGLELVFNLLAPDAPDRYFEYPGSRSPLCWAGELDKGEELWLRDEWLRVAIQISARPAARWWIAPIHTVSQSEGGFEKVYQGSIIMPVWTGDLSKKPLEAEVAVRILRVP